ncbi:hypothetical protein [Dickeya zeae]|uniref:hypothetical protein n=1 Tax=Dickeya zeae TaxID=204042 RepID=UPI001C636241|nr:hypothetical protein [Dickeya zeae]
MIRPLRNVFIVIFILLLNGCSILENGKRYRTDLTQISLNEDLTRKYPNSNGSHPHLYIPGSMKFAELVQDTGDNYIDHAYTTKKMLPQWDDIFQRFIDWKPTENEVIELTDPVTTTTAFRPLGVSHKVSFMEIRGEKYLVFTHHQLPPFSNDIYAYNQKNVLKMRRLFKDLQSVLVD